MSDKFLDFCPFINGTCNNECVFRLRSPIDVKNFSKPVLCALSVKAFSDIEAQILEKRNTQNS